MTLRFSGIKIICWLVVLLAVFSAATQAAQEGSEGIASATGDGAYLIGKINAGPAGDKYVVRIKGSMSPAYTMYELFDPLRIVLDVADAAFAGSLVFPLNLESGPVAKIEGRVLDNKEPAIARLEIFLADDRSYTVEREHNDILVSFQKDTAAAAVGAKTPSVSQKEAAPKESSPPLVVAEFVKEVEQAQAAPAVKEKAKEARFASSTIETKTRVMRVEPPSASAEMTDLETPKTASQPPAPSRASASVDSAFSVAGYKKQGITIDFYKIDLHNVFRLFGEISGMNIVVDEGVAGTLTLALNNVPWDFALDVILNLKDLQKEERFGTIVIATKEKAFNWPKQAVENLEIEADIVDVKQAGTVEIQPKAQAAGITIEQKVETPKEVVEAKKLMQKARAEENREEYAKALPLYEEAFRLWPENGRLAIRLASICLVRLGVNTKAVHYAKAALKIDEKDQEAALLAAIGLTNMKRNAEAKEYFELAVQGSRPAGEALISYAVFAEENGDYLSALLLMARHEDLYGDSLETMLAKARIYDKEGNREKAAAEYKSILLSGFDVPADLKRYINGRIALNKDNAIN